MRILHRSLSKPCVLVAKSRLAPTDPEFRYLNFKSVGINPDLTSRRHSFNADLAQEPAKTM